MSLGTASRVWLQSGSFKYVSGIVDSVTNTEVIVTTEEGVSISVPKGSAKLSQRTPAAMETTEDLSSLPDLNEPNMLHSLKCRYLQGDIYTRTGPILVALNPWQKLDHLYSAEVLESYRGKKMEECAPHVYAIAEAAYASLRSQGRAQTILVSGDSGSGKTESTKIMMHYLAAVAQQSKTTVEQQVLQCNPILEAFGNATTLRNDNSSRFGKYIDIRFDKAHAMCGAKIDTYLLEKSRVVGQEDGERNFHVFYQLCSMAQDASLAATLGLQEADCFDYVRTGCKVATGHLAANSFAATQKAMLAIGITQHECDQIFKVLAAVLHLGNVRVADGKSEEAVVSEESGAARWGAELLGVEEEALVKALTSRHIQAGSEGYTVNQPAEKAVQTRDALSRALYSNLFSALVSRINSSLGEREADEAGTISILDIFGFEHFERNHFEQFCINYANEKLQGHFNEFNFALEIEEYKREEVTWSYADLQFLNNEACVAAIEEKHTGILALLDEQCIVPNGNDEDFCTKLRQHKRDSGAMAARNTRGAHFSVKHYAAEVSYDAREFCFKNKDPVQPSMVGLMASSSSPFVRSLFHQHKLSLDAPPPRTGSASSASSSSSLGSFRKKLGQSTLFFESVSAQFKRQLADLMRRMQAAQPHFVRCVNPNALKRPRLLHDQTTLDQLRCSGLMEAVRVARAGFPVRLLHAHFAERYSLLLDDPKAHRQLSARAQAEALCAAFRIAHNNVRLGNSKVFLRRGEHERLEAARTSLLLRHVVCLQRHVRGRSARLLAQRLREERREAALAALANVRAEPPMLLAAAFKRSLVQRWFLKALTRSYNGNNPPLTRAAIPASLALTPLSPEHARALRAGSAASVPEKESEEEGEEGELLADKYTVFSTQLATVQRLFAVERAELSAVTCQLRALPALHSTPHLTARISALQALLQRQHARRSADGASEDTSRRAEAMEALLALLHHKAVLMHHRDHADPTDPHAPSDPHVTPPLEWGAESEKSEEAQAVPGATLGEKVAWVRAELAKVRELYYAERAANLSLVKAIRELPLLGNVQMVRERVAALERRIAEGARDLSREETRGPSLEGPAREGPAEQAKRHNEALCVLRWVLQDKQRLLAQRDLASVRSHHPQHPRDWARDHPRDLARDPRDLAHEDNGSLNGSFNGSFNGRLSSSSSSSGHVRAASPCPSDSSAASAAISAASTASGCSQGVRMQMCVGQAHVQAHVMRGVTVARLCRVSGGTSPLLPHTSPPQQFSPDLSGALPADLRAWTLRVSPPPQHATALFAVHHGFSPQPMGYLPPEGDAHSFRMRAGHGGLQDKAPQAPSDVSILAH